MKYDKRIAMKNGEGLLTALLSERGTLIELLLVAVLLAVGVNLLSSAVPALVGWPPLTTFIVGLFMCVAAAAFLVVGVYRQLDYDTEIEGFFVYDPKQDEIINVPRYNYASHLTTFFRAAFTENPALRKVWQRDPLTKAFELNPETRTYKCRLTEAGKLVSEATEYYVLSNLSTHLTDYFNDDRLEKERLLTLYRADLPNVIMQNRFMDLFTRPMDQREAFVESLDRHLKSVVAQWGPDGQIYDRFDLVLPDRGKIARLSNGNIEIKTQRMKLTIGVEFGHFNTVLPRDFEQRYLGLADHLQYAVYQVSVKMAFSFRFGALLTRRGWEYYRWVDSFIHELTQNMSERAYFQGIGWNEALTVVEALEKQRNDPPMRPPNGLPPT